MSRGAALQRRKEYGRRYQEPPAKIFNRRSAQRSNAAQNLRHNALVTAENISQVFLPQTVRFHQFTDHVGRRHVGIGIFCSLVLFDEGSKVIGILAL